MPRRPRTIACVPGDSGSEQAPNPGSAPESALPSVGVRVVAFLAVVISGACGALIGYAVADLQCQGSCTVQTGGSAVLGGALAAAGVGIVVVLVLRAMGEWNTIRERDGGAPAPRRQPTGGVRGRPRVQ